MIYWMITTEKTIGAGPRIFGRASTVVLDRMRRSVRPKGRRRGVNEAGEHRIFRCDASTSVRVLLLHILPKMSTTSKDDALSARDAEKEARKRVAEIKDFHGHLLIYLMVNLMLVGIYLATGSDHFWPIYPMLGWGIGLVSHAASVYGMFGFINSEWEERKVREIMLQKQHGLSADQVRTLLRQEMANERASLPSADALTRIDERLRNLEAIVTSRDWDELPSHSDLLRPEGGSELSQEEAESDTASEAARLARRVR